MCLPSFVWCVMILHTSVLQRTPTLKWFLGCTVYERLQAFFRHARS